MSGWPDLCQSRQMCCRRVGSHGLGKEAYGNKIIEVSLRTIDVVILFGSKSLENYSCSSYYRRIPHASEFSGPWHCWLLFFLALHFTQDRKRARHNYIFDICFSMGSLVPSSTFDVLLHNSNINDAYVCDIGIQGGIITAIGMHLGESDDTEVIDCEFAVVTRGGVDGHVHLSQDRSPRAKEAGYVAADTSCGTITGRVGRRTSRQSPRRCR